MPDNLIVTISPHIRSEDNISRMMLDVIIALSLNILVSICFYSWRAFSLILTCIVFSISTEVISQKIMKKKGTVSDFSAVVTGLLLGFCLPPSLPLWIAAIGSIFSILVGKQIFGGLGHNPFNPALVGRAFLQVSWPLQMSTWISPFDGITTATPLTIDKLNLPGVIPSYEELFLGSYAGSLGETSVIALLLGAGYLLLRKRIKLYIPISYIFTVVIIAAILNKDVLLHVLSGGLILGAFFMAADPVTSPLTDKGKLIFGAGCGLLTMIIRFRGGFPEGVCYSILIMNMLTPFIDKITRTKKFGVVGQTR